MRWFRAQSRNVKGLALLERTQKQKCLRVEINVRHEKVLDQGGPTAQGKVRVTVHFKDGTRLDSFMHAPKAVTEPISETI